MWKTWEDLGPVAPGAQPPGPSLQVSVCPQVSSKSPDHRRRPRDPFAPPRFVLRGNCTSIRDSRHPNAEGGDRGVTVGAIATGQTVAVPWLELTTPAGVLALAAALCVTFVGRKRRMSRMPHLPRFSAPFCLLAPVYPARLARHPRRLPRDAVRRPNKRERRGLFVVSIASRPFGCYLEVLCRGRHHHFRFGGACVPVVCGIRVARLWPSGGTKLRSIGQCTDRLRNNPRRTARGQTPRRTGRCTRPGPH